MNTVMSDNQIVFSEIEQQIMEVANRSMSTYGDAAMADAKQLLSDIAEDLQRWTKLLRTGKITRAEFQWLISSAKQLVNMPALKKAGLSSIRIERFAANVLSIISDTILKKMAG